MDISVEHEKEFQQFTAKVGGEEDAELAYAMPSDDLIDFTHTFVPKAARGQGIADKLIEKGLQYARQNNLRVVATCTVVAKYLEDHPEQQDLMQ
ncbi:GNAT family N-acetyltransferase [Pontibacter silvestris]|uniref:GNAT family N-acetyltransferase n=1 Tax=Pontibacter silvestris TaxID=2305183 RepID=A0ABW4X4Y5_9BACT|nr:GNAT family N-acetyltransferase [Pontibacter silvestris]MCC9134797.1 N-acetyltransferase [Pontibacter silvestris]